MRDSNHDEGDRSSLLTTSPMVQRLALCAAFVLAGYYAAGMLQSRADTGAGRSETQDWAEGQESAGRQWNRSATIVRPLLAVDINRASAEELAILPGIGPVAAAAIVESRNADGPFLAVGDLERVHGIGPKTIEAVRPYLLRLAEDAEIAAPANR